MSYWVYIMASKSRKLYIGMTNNFDRRYLEHLNGLSDFTSRYRITRLVHIEEYTNQMSAISREDQLKGWKRDKKIALIESENPTWEDLAADLNKPAAMRVITPQKFSG